MNALPTYEEMFSLICNDPQSPERRALRTLGLAPKDASGIYFEAWEGMRRAWRPGRATFRAAVGARFCRLLAEQEGPGREEVVDPADFESMEIEWAERKEIERWRVADSPEIDRLLNALRATEGKPERTARRHRARLLERVQLNGDLFAGGAA